MTLHATHYGPGSRTGVVALHSLSLRGRAVLLTSRSGRTLRAVVGDYCPLEGRVDMATGDFRRLFSPDAERRQPRGGYPVGVRVLGKAGRAKRRHKAPPVVVRLGTAYRVERRAR